MNYLISVKEILIWRLTWCLIQTTRKAYFYYMGGIIYTHISHLYDIKFVSVVKYSKKDCTNFKYY